MSTLTAIRRSGTPIHEIMLDPLSVDDFGQLLCDALRCGNEEAVPLAALVHGKTGGNPFFAGQFLRNLVEEGLLNFALGSSSWRWTLPSIEAKGFTENVVDLMVRRLLRLSPAAQDALKLLACLGSQADFATLANLQGGSEADVHASFADAVRAGAVLPIERSFKFLHDRVQEAAYALIPSASRAEHHLRVGRLLLASLSERDLVARIFDVVNQLNLGAALIFDREEQRRAAALNLEAARKAKASTAYISACSYLSAAMVALGEQGWLDTYALTFSLWFERAECEFLSSHSRKPLDGPTNCCCARSRRSTAPVPIGCGWFSSSSLGRTHRPSRTALECLRMFGIELPESPTDDQVQVEYHSVWSNLDGRPIGSLLDLPMMADREMSAVMDVLSTLWRSAYFTDGNLCQTIACRMVAVTQKHGTTESAVIGYALLAIFLGPIFHRFREGEEFARLAVAMAESTASSRRRSARTS